MDSIRNQLDIKNSWSKNKKSTYFSYVGWGLVGVFPKCALYHDGFISLTTPNFNPLMVRFNSNHEFCMEWAYYWIGLNVKGTELHSDTPK
jgi:hypothetical protein